MPSRENLQQGAYRIVFNRENSKDHHHIVNLRDRSTDNNLFGDNNIKRSGKKNPLSQETEVDSDGSELP